MSSARGQHNNISELIANHSGSQPELVLELIAEQEGGNLESHIDNKILYIKSLKGWSKAVMPQVMYQSDPWKLDYCLNGTPIRHS